MPSPRILTPLRKLGGPGALARECAVCVRLEGNLIEIGERLWAELQQAKVRQRNARRVCVKAQTALAASTRVVEDALARVAANLGEREAILDRHEELLDAREGNEAI